MEEFRLGAFPGPTVKGYMTEDKQRPFLRLQTGAQVDARSAYVTWRMLEGMHPRRLQELEALYALAHDPAAPLTAAMREVRRREPDWFDSAGQLQTVVREVVQSSVRETPEGLVVAFPFPLATSAELDVLQTIENDDQRFLRDLFLRGKLDPPGRSGP